MRCPSVGDVVAVVCMGTIFVLLGLYGYYVMVPVLKYLPLYVVSVIKITHDIFSKEPLRTFDSMLLPYMFHPKVNEKTYATKNLLSCPKKGKYVQLVVVIPSAPYRESARMSIRQTWGRFGIRKDISIFFLIGKTYTKKTEKNVDKESRLYKDILMGNFHDKYENLPLKSVTMLRWVRDHCPSAKYLLKSDDDVFVNIPRLLKFIKKLNPKKRAIYGRIHKNAKPVRNPKGKHYLPYKEYKDKLLPDFANGPAYLIPVSVVDELYQATLYHQIIRLEDVFLTGIVAGNLGIERINNYEFRSEITNLWCLLQRSISIHKVPELKLYEYWEETFYAKKMCDRFN
ncbi:beta-1,3-galactosyltransferase 1-like [Photinus pyralis]|uniref:beta-1,3-galactosyltransferase 1-like n=1 Tax=Photinus pyralis TaxID=7054 RepID=UPI0012674D74|nr:beta-1,3-galactosyltransferase 1-like [Photinus pyralis]